MQSNILVSRSLTNIKWQWCAKNIGWIISHDLLSMARHPMLCILLCYWSVPTFLCISSSVHFFSRRTMGKCLRRYYFSVYLLSLNNLLYRSRFMPQVVSWRINEMWYWPTVLCLLSFEAICKIPFTLISSWPLLSWSCDTTSLHLLSGQFTPLQLSMGN